MLITLKKRGSPFPFILGMALHMQPNWEVNGARERFQM